MLIALAIFALLIVAMVAATCYLLVLAERATADSHRALLRLDAHEKRIATLERDAGLDDAVHRTWRRPPGKGG